MSVINKVLRDLDQRHGAAHNAADTALRSGTRSVHGPDAPVRKATPRKPKRLWTAGSVVVLALIAGGAWVGTTGAVDSLLPAWASRPVPPHVSQVLPPPPRPAQTADAVGPAPVASAPAEAPLPAKRLELAPALPKLPAPASTSVPASMPAPVPPSAKSGAAVQAPSAESLPRPVLPVASAGSSAPVMPAPPPATNASAPTSVDGGQRQQQAARDALAQAQSLWNANAHEPAIELLQQAVATAERMASHASGASTIQTLVLLVRELGRMQLSEGHPGAVWEMMTRLEPLLRNDPDMWALRANAAQRLGRHQDSVHAYMVALQSRPMEQRWLLGAAVSLAALGQITSAADMAEKARAAGPISRDVQTYLRQMGVAVRD